MGRRLKPEITWGAPPPEETAWDEVAAGLMERPGDYARILADGSISAARKLAQRIRQGDPPWTPAGAYQSAVRYADDEGRRGAVWARYVPVAEQAVGLQGRLRRSEPEPEPEPRPLITRPEPQPTVAEAMERIQAAADAKEAKRKASQAERLDMAHEARRAKALERQIAEETDPNLYAPTNGDGPYPPAINTTIDAALLEEGVHPFGLPRHHRLFKTQSGRMRKRGQALGATVTVRPDFGRGALLMTVRH